MQEWGPRSPKRAKLEKKYGRGDLLVSLGWEAYTGPGRQPQPKAAAYFLGRNGRLLDSMDVPVNIVGDLNWHTKHMSRSVYYVGQKTGSPGYTEQIWVDLSRIPPDCDKVVFVAYIDRGVERQISWGMFHNAYARMSDAGTADQEFLRMKLSDVHKDDMTVILAAVQRRSDVWDLAASGAGTAAAGDLLTTIRSFVEDAYRTDSQRPHPIDIDESLIPPPPEIPPVEEQIAWYDAVFDELENAEGREAVPDYSESDAISEESEHETILDQLEYDKASEWPESETGAAGLPNEAASDSMGFDASPEWAEPDALLGELELGTRSVPQMDTAPDELDFETNSEWSEFASVSGELGHAPVSEWTDSDGAPNEPDSDADVTEGEFKTLKGDLQAVWNEPDAAAAGGEFETLKDDLQAVWSEPDSDAAGGEFETLNDDLQDAWNGPDSDPVPDGMEPSQIPGEAQTKDPS